MAAAELLLTVAAGAEGSAAHLQPAVEPSAPREPQGAALAPRPACAADLQPPAVLQLPSACAVREEPRADAAALSRSSAAAWLGSQGHAAAAEQTATSAGPQLLASAREPEPAGTSPVTAGVEQACIPAISRPLAPVPAWAAALAAKEGSSSHCAPAETAAALALRARLAATLASRVAAQEPTASPTTVPEASAAAERRIDPADGALRTQQSVVEKHAGRLSAAGAEAYWREQCKPLKVKRY
ncbi:unnamed protein product [Prorocentrum cordatum]|uniref:Uncharacterized protein n=1 Tax=Prorocentrum cordatum TaxID=2364126 RepID=A0ABN9WKE4_9DINO|nr:unnamed protein product [Polarella glacialis]